MNLNYDIYGLIEERNKEILVKFLNKYVDMVKSENRQNEEVFILPPVTPRDDWDQLTIDDFIRTKSETLSNHLKIGLDKHDTCFAIYLTPKNKLFKRVIIKFTLDNKLIFGLSTDAGDEGSKNKCLAIETLDKLKSDFNLKDESILLEEPPANDERDFLEMKNDYDIRNYNSATIE